MAGDADAESAWEVEWSSRETQAEWLDAVRSPTDTTSSHAAHTAGEVEWLAADPSPSVVHSREYDDPEVFRGRSVLVVGGRSSGVDISRELRGVAKWVTILEKNCIEPRSYEGEAVTHVPLGTRLCSDGQLRLGDDVPTGACTGASTDGTLALGGPPVDTVVLATGYVYAAELVRLDSWLTPPRTTLKSSTLDRHQVLVPLPRRDGARHALPRQAAGDTALPAYAARDKAHAWLCRHTALRAMPECQAALPSMARPTDEELTSTAEREAGSASCRLCGRERDMDTSARPPRRAMRELVRIVRGIAHPRMTARAGSSATTGRSARRSRRYPTRRAVPNAAVARRHDRRWSTPSTGRAGVECGRQQVRAGGLGGPQLKACCSPRHVPLFGGRVSGTRNSERA